MATTARIAIVAAACLLILVTGTASAATGTQPRREHGRGHWFKASCAVPQHGSASCHAEVVTNASGKPLATGTPTAGSLGPAQFASAYSLPSSASSNATIAIVDAYDNPNIESDLANYSSYYGLPACTTANGCFRKVNQSGGLVLPARDSSWGLEIALDVETAHAVCQGCKILLVEANSPSYGNLGAAVNRAASMGASVISNSYGGGESSFETTYDSLYFNHPGVVITASTGDSGYGVQYPAASPNVVAVGGTTLTLNANGSYRSETAWGSAGSGCSAYEAKPAAQSGIPCARRSVADVSADADPNTGAAVYDTYGYGGWLQVGGTSLSAPLIAAVYALSGNTSNPTAPYANRGALHDVTTGSNGSCGGTYLCTAGVGYDGPTGLGTPNGLAAFGGAPPPPPSPDFSLAVSPSSQSATQGQTTTYSVTISPNASFQSTDSVQVSDASSPTDLVLTGCTVALTAANPSCTLTVDTTGASTTTHSLTVTGTGSTGLPTHTASATLAVQAAPTPDFTLAVAPSNQSVTQGQTASYTVTMSPNGAFTSGNSVLVSGASAPSDVTVSGCAAALTAASPTCTLSVATTGASTTSHALTVTGTGSAGVPTHTASATLAVQAVLAPDYSLTVSPTPQSVTQGQPASYTVKITPNASFTGAASVSISAASVPSDVTLSGCATALTAASPTCTLTADTTGASATSHALTVTGTGSAGVPTHAAAASLTVQAPQTGDFSLSISPSSRYLFTPGSTTFTITVNPLNGFTGVVALSVSGLPSNFTSTFTSSSTSTSAGLTIKAPRSSSSTIQVTITGTSGGLVHSQTVTLNVI